MILLGVASPALLAQEADIVSYGALYKPVCDALVPGFEQSTEAHYARWREQHRDEIAKVEADERFKERQRDALRPPPSELRAAKVRQITPTCEKLANLFEASAPAEARFSSAERTWETFRGALRNAQRESLAACLFGNARRTFSGRLFAMSDDQLKRMEASIAELKLSQRNGPVHEGVILQKDGKAGTIVFVKVGENWKIGEM